MMMLLTSSQPYEAFCVDLMNIYIATPYSHIFDNPDVKRSILSLSDMIEVRGPDQTNGISTSGLWHCELSIVRQWADRHLAYLSSIVKGFKLANVRLEVASFHVPSRYQINEVVNGAFVGQGDPMTKDQMLVNAKNNNETLKKILTEAGFSNTRLLVENNNHLGTDAYEIVTSPIFIGDILDCTGMGLLLDVAHAKITALNTGWKEESYFEELPIERAEQIHLSHHGLASDKAFDAHDALNDDDWRFFSNLTAELPKLKYATIEYYKDANVLADLLKRLRIELDACSGQFVITH